MLNKDKLLKQIRSYPKDKLASRVYDLETQLADLKLFSVLQKRG